MSSFAPTPALAVLMILFASSLWGTWAIALKHLGPFPLDAFILTLFVWSFLYVWVLALVASPGGAGADLHRVAQAHGSILATTLLGGVVYQWGMRIWLFVIHTRGLIFTTSITSSISLMIGTLSSGLAGGLPAGASVPLLALGTLLLLLAVLSITAATALRESNRSMEVLQEGTRSAPALVAAARREGERSAPVLVAPARREGERSTPTPTKGAATVRLPLWAAVGLCALSGLATSAYPTAVALGLRSRLRPDGLHVLTFMAMLASGAVIGALLSSGTMLSLRKQWRCFLTASPRYYAYGILAGFAHYGGNIINAFAVPVISPTIAWPMGTTSSLWGVAWGYVYREYKGAPRRVYALQLSGVALFILGVAILTIAR